jgi:ATP-dependent Clp protease adapter protein ClpS
MPSTFDKDPPLFKVTLFRGGKGSDEVYIANALLECVPGMEIPEAKAVATKVMSIGFGLVGVWPEEVAEGCAEQIRERDMVCDVSKEAQ